MNTDYWKQRCEAAEDALRRARSQLMLTASRKKIIKLLAEVQAGRSLQTGEIAERLNLNRTTAHHALHKMQRAGFVDRSKHRGHIVDRLIQRYSMPGEVVYDPFHGLGTVGVRAIKAGRHARGSELSPAYYADQVHYLRAAEREATMPSLFDALEPEAA